jgi:DNA polymerase/3'-5' exonuclease PolX
MKFCFVDQNWSPLDVVEIKSITNDDVAAVLETVADLLLLQGGEPHRARAFRRSAQVVRGLGTSVAGLLAGGPLASVPGLGPGSLQRIREIVATGTCTDEQELMKRIPVGLRDLLSLRGMSPRVARLIASVLPVRNREDFVVAAKGGWLRRVPGLSLRVAVQIEQQLLSPEGEIGRRLSLLRAIDVGEAMINHLLQDDRVLVAAQAGSVRRRKETIGDLDIVVVTTEATAAVDRFCNATNVRQVLIRGDGRASVVLDDAVQVDLRVSLPTSFGAALHTFTGSRQHNIDLRIEANRRKLTWSEHGVWERKLARGALGEENRKVARCFTTGSTEADMFATLQFPFIPPELREGQGEIAAAKHNRIPELIAENARIIDGGIAPETIADTQALIRSIRRAGMTGVGVWLPDHSDRSRAIAAAAVEQCHREALPLVLFQLEGAELINGAKRALVLAADHDTMTVRTAIERGDVGLLVAARPLPGIEFNELMSLCASRDVMVAMVQRDGRAEVDAPAARVAASRRASVLLCSGAKTAADWSTQWRSTLWQARRAWLSMAQVVSQWGGRAMTTMINAAEAAPDAMSLALAQRPLAITTIARLTAFLAGHEDAELEAGLASLGAVPLQVAFTLLHEPR